MKYYTAFLYAGTGPELHCTHKYFGKIDEEQVRDLCKMIDHYLAMPLGPVLLTFDKEDFMGAGYKTRVLTTRNKIQARLALFPDLRKVFDQIVPDTYGGYVPHVTCNKMTQALSDPFTRYALIGSGGVIIKEWKL